MIIAPLLMRLYDGDVLSDQEWKCIIETINAHHITLPEALALNIWSDNPTPLQEQLKRGSAQAYCVREIHNLKQKLHSRQIPQNNIHDIIQAVENIPYTQFSLKECYDSMLAVCTTIIKPSICASVRNLHIAHSAPEIVKHICTAIMRHPLAEPLTVYRAVKNTYPDPIIINRGLTSTSVTASASFVKYDGYNTILELILPAGFHCINIAPFSNYDDVEQEILLPPNRITVSEHYTQAQHVYIKGTAQELGEFAESP